jgi:N-hydroxyarylamine O-acetyltransferase
VAAVTPVDVGGYLDRLGLSREPPGVEQLCRLHRAHVERVPYENLEIQLGRPTSVDPAESADRIVRSRRGGYCYHLNGAFSALLHELGYEVTRHLAGVQGAAADAVCVNGNHMALTVRGLPHATCPGGEWLVDVGLGSALHEPAPLAEGAFRQGAFEYRLRASDAEPGAWRFDHDPRVGFQGMDFRSEAAAVSEFAAMHEHLSTSLESGFVRVAVAQRRDADGVDELRGVVFRRLAPEPEFETTIESAADWYQALADVFGLALHDVGRAERDGLWRRVLAAHDEYLARAAP